MPVFALVTEGVTDQAVIECILQGLFGSSDAQEFSTNPLQPLRDATDESFFPAQAGWEKVIEYCGSDQLIEALTFNDFVIIQLDTDQGDHRNFNVPLTNGGVERPAIDLIGSTIDKIEAVLGDETCKQFADRIIYAIAVHSTECWLLAHYGGAREKERSKSCHHHLTRAMARENLRLEKTYKSYRDAAHPLTHKKCLYAAVGSCESLRLFYYALQIVTV